MARIAVVINAEQSLITFRGSLIQSLLAAGHEVIGVAPGNDPAVRQQLQDWGAERYTITLSRAGTHLLGELRSVASLWRACRKIKPDIILNCSLKPVLYGGLIQYVLRKPKAYALMSGLGYVFLDSSKQAWWRRPAKWLFAWALRGHQGLIMHNPDDQQTLLEQKIIRKSMPVSVVLGSGVDTTHFSAAPLPGQAVFLLVARLLRDKGVMEYVAAARQLKQSYPEAQCLLVGALDENPSSISQAELDEWVREGVVKYLGFQSDVREAIKQASCFVLPSYREGLSRSIIEAMSMGRAIITTDVPGCRQTISHEQQGLLVPAQNAKALTQAMQTMARDAQLRAQMGQAARVRAEQVFEQQHINGLMMRALGLPSA